MLIVQIKSSQDNFHERLLWLPKLPSSKYSQNFKWKSKTLPLCLLVRLGIGVRLVFSGVFARARFRVWFCVRSCSFVPRACHGGFAFHMSSLWFGLPATEVGWWPWTRNGPEPGSGPVCIRYFNSEPVARFVWFFWLFWCNFVFL